MEGDYEELYKWIENHTISRPKRNINRDFSDAIPLVEILKHHFPKLVEIHNYSPKNSHAQKIINWETLNNKVLKRLKLNLRRKRIEQLANGEPGVIEKLLLEIKQKIETRSTDNESCEVFYLEGNPNSFEKSRQVGVNKKIVPIAVLDKMQADLNEKDEAITILKSKVEHLEHLLDIKEERIKDLTGQLQAIVNQPPKTDSVQGSKFFGFFQTSKVPDPIKGEEL